MQKKPIEPWNIDLSERLRKLTKDPAKKNVIYICQHSDKSTIRYRAYNPCQALDNSSIWTGSYFYETELHILEDYLSTIDLVVFCRICWTNPFQIFMHKVKKHAILTAYDIDDLVFNIEKIPILMNTLGVIFCESSYHNWFSYSARLWMMGKLCDYTLGTNEFLCQQLREVFKTPSLIINNFLNEEQLLVSEPFYHKKKNQTDRSSLFKIGYFSGSATHKNDFDRIVVELSQLLENYPEIHLEIVGYMELPLILQKYREKQQIMLTPFVDFLTLQEKMASVDLNIVPLLDNEFTNCKSELKFFEASVVGTLTCASPTYVFKENIQQGVNGFICQEGEWYDTIERIYKKKVPFTIIENARDYCLKKYSPKNQCLAIENVLNTLLGMPNETYTLPHLSRV